jgi:transcriptional regulator with XRE-family HTH domain
MVDRQQLADFLRGRRAALQPEDVGMPPGARRRTPGLRREEVAALAAMSTDYYTRLEQRRGPQPSSSILTSLARALRLTQDERDHLFVLAGHAPPARARRSDHVSPALLRVLDRLDTPALVVTDLGVTLAQNPPAVALLGDQTGYTGFERFLLYRWFTLPQEREVYPEHDRDHHEAQFVSQLRAALARDPDEEPGHELVDRLLADSPVFAAAWARHEVSIKRSERKRIVSPAVGLIEVHCQTLTADEDGQFLLVFTATPGTNDQEKMRLLGVIGDQRFAEPELLASPSEPE